MLEVWVRDRWVAYPSEQVPSLVLADRLDLGAPARRPGAVHAEPLVDHLEPGQLGLLLEQLLGSKCLCQASERTLRKLRRLTEPASPSVWRGVSPMVYRTVLWCRAVLKDIAGEIWEAIATYSAFLALAGRETKDRRVRIALNNRAALAVRRGILTYVSDFARLVLDAKCAAAVLNLVQIRHVARANGWLRLLEEALTRGVNLAQVGEGAGGEERAVEGERGDKGEGRWEGAEASGFIWQRVEQLLMRTCHEGPEDGCFLLLDLSDVCPYPADVWSRSSCLDAFATALLRAVWDALGAGRCEVARSLVTALQELPAVGLSSVLDEERRLLEGILGSVEAAQWRARFLRDLGEFEPKLRRAAAAESTIELTGATRELRAAVARLHHTANELALGIENTLQRLEQELADESAGLRDTGAIEEAIGPAEHSLVPDDQGAEWALAYLEQSAEERARNTRAIVCEVAESLAGVLRHTRRLSARDVEALARLTKIMPEWANQVAARWFSSKLPDRPDFHRIVIQGDVEREIIGLGDVLADLPTHLATAPILDPLTSLICGRMELLARLGFRPEEVANWVNRMVDRQIPAFERWRLRGTSEELTVLRRYLDQLTSLCAPLPEPPSVARARQLVEFLDRLVQVELLIQDNQAEAALEELRTLSQDAPGLRSVYSRLLSCFCASMVLRAGRTVEQSEIDCWVRGKLSPLSDEELRKLTVTELESLAEGFVSDAAG